MFKKVLFVFLVLLTVLFFNAGVATAKNDGQELKLKVFVHNPGKPTASPACLATINDQVADYGTTGWYMPTAGMTYQINYDTRPANLTVAQVQTAITNSFSTWMTADSKQIFTDGGSTIAKNARLDGTNAILWKRINGSALAITYSWVYQSGLLAESDTVFNSKYPWSYTPYAGSNDCGGVAGTYDVQNIATHEFGHWIGLDDLIAYADRDLTMYGYGYTTELKADSLGTGDILGVNNINP